MKKSPTKSIGKVTRVRVSDGIVDFRCSRGVARIELVSDDILRVRVGRKKLDRDHSFAVIEHGLRPSQFSIDETADEVVLRTPHFSARIARREFAVQLADPNGKLLTADTPGGVCFEGESPLHRTLLERSEAIFGLGETMGAMNKRFQKHQFWNTDVVPHHPDTSPLYKTLPLAVHLRPDACFGRFYDNTFRSYFDCGYSSPEVLSYKADGGELNYYFLCGPTPPEVMRQYGELTGRMEMPAIWSLGHQQCRWSYETAKRVREIATELRRRRIPTDVIYLDIDYMDEFRVFTWNRKSFPNPARLASGLANDGFKLITIVDPGVKVDRRYTVYRQGTKNRYFCYDRKGKPYRDKVWPGLCEYPDFFRPDVRQWWGGLQKQLLDVGVAGIWNDMNEPSAWEGVNKTLPEDLLHVHDGRKQTHAKLHNVYGMAMAQASREGIDSALPDDRSFVLTRAAYAGVQRYSAVWLGDNSSWWSHLANAIPMCLNVGMSGVPFVGVDIGGFTHDCTPQLYARWIELGAFLPLCRTHSCKGTRDQEPWSFGEEVESIARRYLNLRYQLLPYTYCLFHQAHQAGLPVMRPMYFHFPGDETTHRLDDQFMWGESLLVAPVVKEHARERAVYLPEGAWFDFWSGQLHPGRTWVVVQSTLDHLPLFVRAGSTIPMTEPVQHTGELPGRDVTLDVFPGGSSGLLWYEDDGISRQYRSGAFSTRQIQWDGYSLHVGARVGSFEPGNRQIRFRFRYLQGHSGRVRLDGREVQASREGDSWVISVLDDGSALTIE